MDHAFTRDDDRDHVVQFYDDESGLISEVGRAMCIALDQGCAVVCLATEAHWRLLEQHVLDRGIDVRAAKQKGQITCLDASATLAQICRDGEPDVVRFAEVIGAEIDLISSRYARVWIFGELVALLSTAGHFNGAVQLERLWTSFTAARPGVFLHCAYPAHAFTSRVDRVAFVQICDEHCRVLHSESSLAIGEAGD